MAGGVATTPRGGRGRVGRASLLLRSGPHVWGCGSTGRPRRYPPGRGMVQFAKTMFSPPLPPKPTAPGIVLTRNVSWVSFASRTSAASSARADAAEPSCITKERPLTGALRVVQVFGQQFLKTFVGQPRDLGSGLSRCQACIACDPRFGSLERFRCLKREARKLAALNKTRAQRQRLRRRSGHTGPRNHQQERHHQRDCKAEPPYHGEHALPDGLGNQAVSATS